MIRGYQRLSRRLPSANFYAEMARVYYYEAMRFPKGSHDRNRLTDIARDLMFRAHAATALGVLGAP